MSKPSYTDRLQASKLQSGSLLCLGIDPILDYLPEEFSGDVTSRVVGYFTELLSVADSLNVIPGAFKPNIGYFHALDRPREGLFDGSLALARILDLIRSIYPEIPIILDAKRGDIARSSVNYGREAFAAWGVDAVTASAYMGDDSVLSIVGEAQKAAGLVYALAITSNPGARQFQTLRVEDGRLVAAAVAVAVCKWHRETGCLGAVVGATQAEVRDELLSRFAEYEVPVLIPGVGSQGGEPADVMRSLRQSGYPESLARVNVSSAIIHPWRDNGAPPRWRQVVGDALQAMHGSLQ